MVSESVVGEKSKKFAIRIIKLYNYLQERKKGFALSKQLLRSGTSIGANVREGLYAQTKKDFVFKMSVALKECSETVYWLELLHETEFLTSAQFIDVNDDCVELLKMLTAIVKTAKSGK